jgi:MFS family permease
MTDAGSAEPQDHPGEESSLTPAERKRLTKRPKDGAITAVLALTGLIAAFMQTIVTPIVPELPTLLGTTSANATWVLTATLLAAAISTPISGRLGDMYGKRRVMLALLGFTIAGSVVCAFSNTLLPMIAGRVLEGFGLGVIALGISILRDVIHPKSLGGAVALVSATLGVGGAIGLPVAAVIAQNLDFHYLFWLAALLSIASFVLVFAIVPVSTLRTGGKFDYPGAIGFALGLVGILLALSKGSEWGWSSARTLGLFIGGAVVLIAWGFYELRAKESLIDLRVAARRPVLLTNLASITVGFGFFITTAAFPTLLEAPTSTGVGLGLTLIVSSLCLVPLGLVMFLLSPVAARLTNARGPRTSLLLGIIVVTAAYVFAAILHSEVWHVILVTTVVGVGVGFAYAAMPTLIMRAVPPNETAASNGLNSVMRTLGSTIGGTLVGTILAGHLTMSNGIGIPTSDAFRIVFLMGAGVTLVGFVLAFFIPRHNPAGVATSLPE